MTPLQTILWLEKVEKDSMDSYEICKPDLYGTGSWWRTAYEKALSKLSDAEIEEYNKRQEVVMP